MNNKFFLITRPKHDTTTHYLYCWNKLVLEEADKRGIPFVDFSGERANRKDVEKFLVKQNPSLVIFNGHGDADLIKGHKDEILIKLRENENLLRSKIIYAVSCRSAQVLGKEGVSSGIKCFLGYTDDFVFIFDKAKTAEPLQDGLAKNFLQPSNTLVKSLLKGNTTKEAYQKSQRSFKEIVNCLLTSEVPGAENIVWWLLWDKDNQVLLGDEEGVF